MAFVEKLDEVQLNFADRNVYTRDSIRLPADLLPPFIAELEPEQGAGRSALRLVPFRFRILVDG